MDAHKRNLDKCGKGGIKCECCKHKDGRNKDRKWSRIARRRLTQGDFVVEYSYETTEHLKP